MKATKFLYTCAVAALLTSCVEDEGSYDLHPINEIKIDGIEESYSKVSKSESLTIEPKVELSMKDVDESNLVYQWFFTSGDPINKKHLVIGNEKNLNYKVDIAPGSYTLNFQIYDKTTGLKWEKETTLKSISPMVRGLYLFGDKEDGTCGIDFVSMMDKRDTMVVSDIFINSKQLKGAQNLAFSGTDYKPDNVRLYAVTQSGTHALEFSSSKTAIDVNEDITTDRMFFPTIPVSKPLKIVNIAPGTFGPDNRSLNSRSRVMLTENEIFMTYDMYSGEAYGNPVNHYQNSKDLFKPFPKLFYDGSSSYLKFVYAYDMTNHRFVGFNGWSFGYANYAMEIQEQSDTPFSFDQTKYDPVRDLVHLDNGKQNSGRSYALMKDANNDFFIYMFAAKQGISKKGAADVDKSVAIDFDKASHYTFFSAQTIVLYSVGSQLWAYDYQRNDAKMVKDFGAEITYLSMDEHSGDEPTDFIVATYSNADKGVVSKFTLADDQNAIKVTPKEKEVWKTGLRVVKVEYRNCPL